MLAKLINNKSKRLQHNHNTRYNIIKVGRLPWKDKK